MNADIPDHPPKVPETATPQLEYQAVIIKDPLRRYLWIAILINCVLQIGPIPLLIAMFYRNNNDSIVILSIMGLFLLPYWGGASMILSRRKRLLTILDLVLLAIGYPLMILLFLGIMYIMHIIFE